jgi:hypothetical protein
MRSNRLVSCILLTVATGCSVNVRATQLVPPVAQPLDTTAWITLWSDNFNRAELGERWKPTISQWSVAGGTLKGVFARDRSVPFEFYTADVTLQGRPLPETVEIRYESWSPAEIGSEAKLLNDDGTRGIIAALYGTPHPALQAKAAVVFVMTGANRFDTVATNPRFAFKPQDHHQVRIVRQPEGVTAFVDGEQVISAAVGTRPESREPNLHLVGDFGKEGTVVFFDNLEIRVPAIQKDQPK